MVYWRARTLNEDRAMVPAVIRQVLKGGFSLDYPHTLPVGTKLNIEFYIDYRDKKERIRAKTETVYSLLRSNSESAHLEAKIIFTTAEEVHTLNNILMVFAESREVNLRL